MKTAFRKICRSTPPLNVHRRLAHHQKKRPSKKNWFIQRNSNPQIEILGRLDSLAEGHEVQTVWLQQLNRLLKENRAILRTDPILQIPDRIEKVINSLLGRISKSLCDRGINLTKENVADAQECADLLLKYTVPLEKIDWQIHTSLLKNSRRLVYDLIDHQSYYPFEHETSIRGIYLSLIQFNSSMVANVDPFRSHERWDFQKLFEVKHPDQLIYLVAHIPNLQRNEKMTDNILEGVEENLLKYLPDIHGFVDRLVNDFTNYDPTQENLRSVWKTLYRQAFDRFMCHWADLIKRPSPEAENLAQENFNFATGLYCYIFLPGFQKRITQVGSDHYFTPVQLFNLTPLRAEMLNSLIPLAYFSPETTNINKMYVGCSEDEIQMIENHVRSTHPNFLKDPRRLFERSRVLGNIPTFLLLEILTFHPEFLLQNFSGSPHPLAKDANERQVILDRYLRPLSMRQKTTIGQCLIDLSLKAERIALADIPKMAETIRKVFQADPLEFVYRTE